MARPKSNTPNKGKINLAVSAQTRAELSFISEYEGQSISTLVAAWAAKEARRIAKQTGKTAPDINQLTITDQIDEDGNVLFLTNMEEKLIEGMNTPLSECIPESEVKW